MVCITKITLFHLSRGFVFLQGNYLCLSSKQQWPSSTGLPGHSTCTTSACSLIFLLRPLGSFFYCFYPICDQGTVRKATKSFQKCISTTNKWTYVTGDGEHCVSVSPEITATYYRPGMCGSKRRLAKQNSKLGGAEPRPWRKKAGSCIGSCHET